MSTRTRRKERGEKKTKEQRRKERWQAKVDAAQGAAARFAVKTDRFRASVQYMLHRHSHPGIAGQVTDPRAIAQADRVLEHAGELIDQLNDQLNGGVYDLQ